MAQYPSSLAGEFLDAGADLLTVHVENGEREAGAAIEQAAGRGCGAGVALRLETPVRAALSYLDAIEVIILLGTDVGVKGRDLAPQVCDRLREARSLLREHAKGGVLLVADGGIRARTVGELCGRGCARLAGLPVRGLGVYVSLAPRSLGPGCCIRDQNPMRDGPRLAHALVLPAMLRCNQAPLQ